MANNPTDAIKSGADAALQSADQAIESTQKFSNSALDSLSRTVKNLQDQLHSMADAGVDAAREGSHKIRDHAQQASDRSLAYIKQEPVKAILIAAASGAALMALISLMRKSGCRD